MSHRPLHTSHNQGFTLIELSVVLIIVGLILGGIMQGRNLLEAAEIRGIYTEAQSHTANISNFIDKYGSLPGDMYNAEDVWGQAAAGNACKTTDNGNKTTCNGDGNGQIALGETDDGAGDKTVEHFRAWQQLNSAGLLQARMTGIPGAGGDDHAEVGINVPRGPMDGTGFTLYYQPQPAASPFFFVAGHEVYNHILHFGQETAAGVTDDPALLPQQAWEVDAKVDDGIPFSGTVRTYDNTTQSNCVDADDDTATYTVTYDDGIVCNLIFITGF